jgi:hypothetical protein
MKAIRRSVQKGFTIQANWKYGQRTAAWNELWRRILAEVLVNTTNSEVANTVLEELDGDDGIMA